MDEGRRVTDEKESSIPSDSSFIPQPSSLSRSPLFALADSNGEPEFSPDSRTLAIAMKDNSVRFFDLATGQESHRIALDVLPERLAFHPDGRKLAVSSNQPPRAEVRDVKSGRILYALPHPASVLRVAWHPEGRLLASGCGDHRIYLWDGASGGARGVLEGHGWEVDDLAFNQTGDRLASFGWDMTLRLWEIGTRKQLWHLENMRMVGFRREEPFMAAGISDQQVRLWTSVPSTEFEVVRDLPCDGGCEFSPDSRWLAIITAGATHIWDFAQKRAVGGFADARFFNWDGAGNALVVTKDGRLLRHAMAARTNRIGDQLRVGPGEILLSASDGFEAGAPRPLANELLGVHVLPPRGAVQMFELNPKARKVWARSFPNICIEHVSPDGRWWAIGTLEEGRGVSILQTRTGERVKELSIGDAYPQFSPDSRWLVTTTGRLTVPGGECCLWRTGTWEKVCSLPLRHSTSSPAILAISPDSALLAVDYDLRQVKLLKLETLEEVATLTPPQPGINKALGFSPNGRYLGVLINQTVGLWDLQALRRSLRAIDLDWNTPASTLD
jgi:WD40 repeat protein